MSFLFKIASFICVAFLLSCYLPPNINAPNQTGQPGYPGQTNYQQPVIGQPFTGGIQQPGTQTVISQPSRGDNNLPEPDRRRGSGCENERSSHRCHQLCREMYSRDRDECLEEEPNIIENIYEVYQALENARGLDSINFEDFEIYLDVSITSLTSVIREYNRNDAEDMLIWIAEDNEAAELIRGEDDDFRILNDLLSLMVRFDNTKIDVPFTRRINNRDTLMDYALNSGNEEALDYFIEYILMGSKACRTNNATRGCLTLMCKIGRASVERDRGYYFDSRVFEDFISEIIDGKINGDDRDRDGEEDWVKGSGDDKIDSLSDLDYSWAGKTWNPNNGERALCGGL